MAVPALAAPRCVTPTTRPLSKRHPGSCIFTTTSHHELSPCSRLPHGVKVRSSGSTRRPLHRLEKVCSSCRRAPPPGSIQNPIAAPSPVDFRPPPRQQPPLSPLSGAYRFLQALRILLRAERPSKVPPGPFCRPTSPLFYRRRVAWRRKPVSDTEPLNTAVLCHQSRENTS